METTINVKQTNTTIFTKNAPENSISTFWEKLEFYRFGIIPMLLFIIGCLGGVAAAFGAQADIFKLALVAFPTIISLALVLAVSPMRAIFFASAIAFLFDAIVFII
jgi:hypothetical protein